jgi:hypothetical protein
VVDGPAGGQGEHVLGGVEERLDQAPVAGQVGHDRAEDEHQHGHGGAGQGDQPIGEGRGDRDFLEPVLVVDPEGDQLADDHEGGEQDDGPGDLAGPVDVEPGQQEGQHEAAGHVQRADVPPQPGRHPPAPPRRGDDRFL